ncbi:hypothetical protein P5G51_002050 [Virgibacillus sp. 179-BFC.A HS]|uniref:Uncharacterized protein n=1 Tax=Tigheibacillus jepli TaxID=3035914 RepID=A0ABU5CDE1_9BACI|nr:hypothetical protein [Virgibacillus sp. 179-BFC.A HS]MDY0404359.1 hypothetical protein [Virgibacillus sp. 179-BFC.A HS]
MTAKSNISRKSQAKVKRVTTVPQFNSTKKLIEQNKKILRLVSEK